MSFLYGEALRKKPTKEESVLFCYRKWIVYIYLDFISRFLRAFSPYDSRNPPHEHLRSSSAYSPSPFTTPQALLQRISKLSLVGLRDLALAAQLASVV
jgi:hypothetical protein